MRMRRQGRTLCLSGLGELGAANALIFRQEACAALEPELDTIEIDLAQTSLVDSSGLGALISVYKAANQSNNNGGVTLRLLNPLPPVQQVIELTRLHHLFEVEQRPDPSPAVTQPDAAAPVTATTP